MTAREQYPMKFGSEVVAQPSEVSGWKAEKIWSENAGRASDCGAVGDIRGIKKTLTLTWYHLTPEEVKQLNKYISNVNCNFFTITLLNEEFEYRTYTVYAATPTYDIWGWDEARQFCKGLSVELIEQ